MPLTFLQEPPPALGMVRDQPSWKLPPGAAYDFLNFVFDTGIPRQRMGSTALVSGSQTGIPTILGFSYSADATPIEQLYGINGKIASSNGVVINKSTGAYTITFFGPSGIYGRPVRHFGFLCFPSTSNSDATYNAAWLAGQSTSTIFTSANTANIVAANPQITLTSTDVTTNVQVGAVVYGFTATNYYIGRVISVDTTKLFTVWPTPTVTFSPGGTNLITGPSQGSVTTLMTSGGACAASFQNRMLFGGVNTQGVSPAVTPITRYDRRVSYSPLPTEHGGFNGDTAKPIDGAPFIWRDQYPALNYFDVPGSDPIVSMEPVAGNQLLILTSTHPVVFSGDLVTELSTTSPTVTYDISEINVNASCLSDLSVQRTPRGVVWAGAGGIYAWDGRQPVDITTGLVNTFWRSQVRGASFAIHGAAYVRGYYILSYTSGGTTQALIADLSGKQPKWGRASGAGTDNFFGVARPTDPSQVFAIRWWDQTGTAPSFTNGQILRLESMLNPYSSGATTDADGSAITISATTRTITGDPEVQKLFQRATVRHQQSSTTAAVAVTAQSKIDAADISAASVRAIGSLSNTSVLTISSASNANPIVVTTSTNHGLQSDDFVDIDGVTGNTNANGRWRIAVTGATTFSLVGGIGNGASGGSPTCKKLTETDYLISTLNAGQGVSFKFDGAPNNFELHGITTAVFQKAPVNSA